MLIAVDFDGTIVTHRYPEIGEEIPFAVDTLKMLRLDGHRLILWSVREGHLLDEAVSWCRERGLEFYAVNRDYPEETTDNNPHFSRKLKVGGLTKSEAEDLVADKIRPYLAENENPVVTITMASYSVAVLGEVNRPGSFQVSREKITIFEALAQAGDLWCP